MFGYLKCFLTTFLDIQQSMFMLAMKSNALDTRTKLANLNPLTQLLCTLLANKMISCFFLEYFKLANIVMVQVLGSMEAKQIS
jgi:hypothetical protein